MNIDGVLHGTKISLRCLSESDATPAYQSWLVDPMINGFLEVRFTPPQSLAALAAFIADCNTSSHSLLLGICDKQDGRHVGNIKLGPIDWNHNVGDIGIIVGDRSAWGKGFASEAIGLVADHAFHQLKLAKLTAGCYDGNEGSVRAFLKAGFSMEGRKISQWQTKAGRVDGLLMGRVNPLVLKVV